MGWEEFKWQQPAHHQLWSQQSSKDFIIEHTVQLKPMIKAHFSGRMVSSGISDVVITSVHSEKNHLKKLMIMIIIFFMNKSQETTVFSGC